MFFIFTNRLYRPYAIEMDNGRVENPKKKIRFKTVLNAYNRKFHGMDVK